jgi:alanine racemase
MIYDTVTLDVDLAALVRNWQLLKQTHNRQQCAAVVKANAYGLGVEPVAAALADAGCQHFFVATLPEAIELRQLLTSQFIYVFDGVQHDEARTFLSYNLIPVLNDWGQLQEWEKAVKNTTAASAVLHVDTGMNRLGFSKDEAEKLALEPERVAACHIRMVMSHLACADTPGHPLNEQQREAFLHVRKCFPTLSGSLANSAGIFLNTHYHHDMGRPGCALYGINPTPERPNPVEPVATLSAPVLQVRTTGKQEEFVGYGASEKVLPGTRIAVVAAGYADGWQRILSGSGVYGYINGHKVRQIGRVSMDLTTFDVTNLPDGECEPGMKLEFINKQQDVNMVAARAQTIGYEIFTGITKRVRRNYS